MIRRAWRWLRRRPNAVAFALIVAVAAAGLQNASAQRDELCRAVEQQRGLIADLIDVALADDGGLPLSALPEFRALDPATQTYFLALERLSQQDRPNSTEDRLRRFEAERLVPGKCET